MEPIQGIFICMATNFYGTGFTAQDAYNDLRAKIKNDIPDIDSCQIVFATQYI